MTRSDAGRKGRAARAELEATEAAFLKVREDLLERIAATAPAQKEERETAYHAIWVLGRVREALIAAATQADLEDYQAAIDKVTNDGSSGGHIGSA